jgi:hypothetical protein
VKAAVVEDSNESNDEYLSSLEEPQLRAEGYDDNYGWLSVGDKGLTAWDSDDEDEDEDEESGDEAAEDEICTDAALGLLLPTASIHSTRLCVTKA